MTGISDLPPFLFARWDADDALDALHSAGLTLDHVEQARWPNSAPQPRTQRQGFTFRSPGVVDPHLLLVFASAPALEVWRLWLARYWKARPYLSIHDNVLLLVSRDLLERDAAVLHEALAQLGRVVDVPSMPVPSELDPTVAPPHAAPNEAVPADAPRG